MNDFFYLDTSVLMDPEMLRPFLENSKHLFLEQGKTIIITPAVRAELVRHLDSKDEAKREKAEEAAGILADFQNLFQAPGGKLDDDEVEKAFADAELLALLMLNRRGHRQLLIANDRKLTADAFGLNRQLSCNGAKISVCHLNRYGNLQVCDCVNDSDEQQEKEAKPRVEKLPEDMPNEERRTEQPQSGDTMDTLESPLITDESLLTQDTDIKAEKQTHEPVADSNNPVWKWILAIGGGAVGGYAVGRYGAVIATLLKTAVRF